MEKSDTWVNDVIDIEAAFLNAKLETETYIDRASDRPYRIPAEDQGHNFGGQCHTIEKSPIWSL